MIDMKRFVISVLMLSMAFAAAAQEFNKIPRAWKWVDADEVLFTYDGTFADSEAFAVNAKNGKVRTGVSAPE